MVTTTPTATLDTSTGSNPGVERIYDNVQVTLPSVQLSVVKLALWNAIEEFALRSTYFREEVTWQMGVGVSSVEFNPFDGNWQVCWVVEQEGLTRWHVRPPSELVDRLTPVQARSGRATLALKPLAFTSDIPAVLFTNWFETMQDGTLHRLYGQPAKPYSSPQLAQYHGVRFRQGITRARDITTRGNSNQAPAWRFPYFASGHRK